MWSKDVDFDPDELGTQPSGTPFFKSDMAFMPKVELGANPEASRHVELDSLTVLTATEG